MGKKRSDSGTFHLDHHAADLLERGSSFDSGQLLSQYQVAYWLHVTDECVMGWCKRVIGPQFVFENGKFMYKYQDVVDWLNERAIKFKERV